MTEYIKGINNEQPKEFNDVVYGKATVKAIAMNEWVLMSGKTTKSHQAALKAAVAMNKLLGGETMPAQRMSGMLG
ncbi:MAG: hypothetical protein JKY50_07350 [Oleispira sp.]|nr:hypothetical protein [Oleispira sp.]MBL4881183.1 hypothetical protein [Oleispira sp.]